ncbi:hypothetical protein [Domibacillus sp. PGB-M46]|uniref:hypothetical protein n=1 Tax=Domibacillus sp. PGB-M46 TaxID=2910255 RepID=UPI001F5A9DB9|nr:hypothetical protein [Domibacillus sp. PGB-M46]
MKDNNKIKYPKILVISNNVFSETSNNGKTLASFFTDFPSDNIAQLYFNNESPNHDYYNQYFRITDSEMIKSFGSKNHPGKVMKRIKKNDLEIKKDTSGANYTSKIKKYNFFRIGRELLWMSKKWQTENLNEWLDKFSPDIIFFCAGDSGFAYNVTEYIQKKFNSKLVVYITDDYILPRKTLSPFWGIRRRYIYSKMKKIVQKSDLYLTISEEMRKTYKNLFGIDSSLAMNMTESLKQEGNLKEDEGTISLVYAGGLHFKRYETLNLIAQAIKKYNAEFKEKKAILKIYSGSKLDEKMQNLLNIPGASEYCGSLNSKELKSVLNQCDIPIHVESFDKKSIESTRLSLSTKIPEYLSLKKPILAVGPNKIASMSYLEDCAFCITNPENLYEKLKILLNDRELKNNLSRKALVKYEKKHQKEVELKLLVDKIINVNKF